MRLIALLLSLLLAGSLTACAGGVAATDAARSEREAFDAQAYTLGTGDEVRITVFDEPDLSGTVRVDGAGEVTLPLIGAVAARGLTVDALAKAAAAKLSAGYLRDPRVTAEVVAYRPYYILGEVERPGTYPYQSGLTVLNAVATAEGFTYRANEKVVLIRKDGAQQDERFRLDSTTPVRPGDTIRITERFF